MFVDKKNIARVICASLAKMLHRLREKRKEKKNSFLLSLGLIFSPDYIFRLIMFFMKNLKMLTGKATAWQVFPARQLTKVSN